MLSKHISCPGDIIKISILFFFFLILSCEKRDKFPWIYSTGYSHLTYFTLTIGNVDKDVIPEVVMVDDESNIHVINGEDGSLLWRKDIKMARWEYNEYTFPSIGDIDGDKKQEIVVGYNGKIFALNGENGSILWSHEICAYPTYRLLLLDINGDGSIEVIIADRCRNICALNGKDGAVLWCYTTQYYIGAPPSAGDIDNDGKPEIVVGSEDYKIYALNGEDGSLLWSYDTGYFVWRCTPRIVDLDRDGKVEVVAWSGDNKLFALNGEDGSLKWTYKGADGDDALFISTSVSINDIDGDGKLEVIAPGDKLYALNGEDGSLLWFYPFEDGAYGFFSMVSDVDMDGENEVIFGYLNMLYAIKGKNGSLLWSYKKQTEVGRWCDPAIGDVDNDGKPEIVIGAEKLYVFNGEDGSLLGSYPTKDHVLFNFIEDINKDGSVDIVFGTREGKIYALSLKELSSSENTPGERQ
jgi:outer membrane protein assembly factor BamB